jgi:hypothetical protein
VVQRYYGYYRCAIRDALNRFSRAPFQCGGLQGYDQLVGIDEHLNNRRLQNGPDPYLDQLAHYVQKALRTLPGWRAATQPGGQFVEGQFVYTRQQGCTAGTANDVL